MNTRIALVLIALLAPATARGFALEPPISLAPYGGGVRGSTGNVVALTPTSFLVAAAGPDETIQTADDQVLLVTGIDGVPQVTPLATPYLPTWSRITRLSATRAAVIQAGADGSFSTADDGVHLLLGLGTTNTVTTRITGPLADVDYSMAVPFGPDLAVMAAIGPDASFETPDDVLHILSDIGGASTVTTVPAADGTYQARAARLTPTSFLSNSNGPDGNAHTADDVTYLFTDVGGTNTRTPIATPYRMDGRPGQASRLSPTSAIMAGTGPDASSSTADDTFLLITDLGGANAVTQIPAPYQIDWSSAGPRRISETQAVSVTVGPDGASGTADDGLILLRDLGTSNTVSTLTIGYLGNGPACGLWPLSTATGVLVSIGPDADDQTLDDEIVLVSDLFGSNGISRIPMPGLACYATHKPLILGAESFLVQNGGPDGFVGNAGAVPDDQLARVGGVGTAPYVQSLPSGQAQEYYNLSARPEILGGGRAAYAVAGPDNASGTGGDDQIRVLANLDLADTLRVTKLSIKSSSKGEKASVKAELAIGSGVLALGDVDVVVSIGPAAEILPASGFVDKGKKIEYKAPKGSGGLVSKLTWQPDKGTLSIKAGGADTGLEDTNADHIPVALELLALSREEGRYLADGVAGTVKGSKISFKAPKN